MKLKELFDMTNFDSAHRWNFYKDNIKLDFNDYELFRNLEIYNIKLGAYFNTPYEGAGINISIYLKEPGSKIK